MEKTARKTGFSKATRILEKTLSVKKIFLLCFLLLCTLSFAQIYRGEGEGKNGTIPVSLHFVEYDGSQYLFYINGVSIFMNEDHIIHLKMMLEKYSDWETLAAGEQILLTKTLDSIDFAVFHFNNTFFREPLTLYFVFTGGPAERPTELAGGMSGETPAARYMLFVDSSLEIIASFRLSSATVQELLDALSPEKLADARDAYERQKALEEMFK
ncbi:MAG: hypothetical protein FWG27_08050 [Treponema sp.]|nr:hypothetical protein [Treponema sp.]